MAVLILFSKKKQGLGYEDYTGEDYVIDEFQSWFFRKKEEEEEEEEEVEKEKEKEEEKEIRPIWSSIKW